MLLLVVAALCACSSVFAQEFAGQYFSGTGDTDYLQLLDISRRMWAADPVYQTVPMLYSGGSDGLLEGPTWDAWWTQNSYGTTMTSLPFMDAAVFRWTRHSQEWWFDHMANGSQAEYGGNQGWAPDGCLCDDGGPTYCNYKQGDGNVPIHDWTLEETLSAVIMQAELLLISRNETAIAHFLPLFLRTLNLIESRRDTTVNMLLSGPSSNLLAPSFAAWKLEDGKYAHAYLAGLSISYIAALNRVLELETLMGNEYYVALYSERIEATYDGLFNFLAPTGDYFVKSIDPNGTVHGVLGQDIHGYFETSPNHDAIAWRVVDDALAEKIFARIVSLGSDLRPNVFVLPNYPGYDDMEGSPPYEGLWSYGYWVNGGVWTTCEARMIMAYYRLGATDDCAASVRQILTFADIWRMDNPLTNFGASVYQPSEPINLTIDAFGSPSAFIRGLFEYLYQAFTLTLIPHVPTNVTQLQQNFGIRWGAYMLFIDCSGNSSSGIQQVTINGIANHPALSFNATAAILTYSLMPTASPLSLLSVNSSILTASTRVNISLTFSASSSAMSSSNDRSEATPRTPTGPKPSDRFPAGPGGITAGLNLWLKASDLSLQEGDPVALWTDASPEGNNAHQGSTNLQPIYHSTSFNGFPSVSFDGINDYLEGILLLPENKTIIAAFRDTGSTTLCCSGMFFTSSCNGLETAMDEAGNVHLMLDWAGSSDEGLAVINNLTIVASLTYSNINATMYLESCIDDFDGAVSSPSLTYMVGSRGADPAHADRYFKGDIAEIAVFNRTLSDSERMSVVNYMTAEWSINNPNPKCVPQYNCSIPPSIAPQLEQADNFLQLLAGNETTQETYVQAHASLFVANMAAYVTRCEMLTNGTLSPLPSPTSDAAALQSYLTTAQQLWQGLVSVLGNYQTSADPLAQLLSQLWAEAKL
eukprot:m.309148 g.309148  ORF g.309148 m.309148 type:complete len:926 (+) comp55339_c0_seq1:5-2782(+)